MWLTYWVCGLDSLDERRCMRILRESNGGAAQRRRAISIASNAPKVFNLPSQVVVRQVCTTFAASLRGSHQPCAISITKEVMKFIKELRNDELIVDTTQQESTATMQFPDLPSVK